MAFQKSRISRLEGRLRMDSEPSESSAGLAETQRLLAEVEAQLGPLTDEEERAAALWQQSHVGSRVTMQDTVDLLHRITGE